MVPNFCNRFQILLDGSINIYIFIWILNFPVQCRERLSRVWETIIMTIKSDIGSPWWNIWDITSLPPSCQHGIAHQLFMEQIIFCCRLWVNLCSSLEGVNSWHPSCSTFHKDGAAMHMSTSHGHYFCGHVKTYWSTRGCTRKTFLFSFFSSITQRASIVTPIFN